MFRNLISVSLVVFFTLGSVTIASALGDRRKGLIIGGGVGIGKTSFSFESESVVLGNGIDRDEHSYSDSEFGFMNNLKIGYAPSDILQIYYLVKVSWFRSVCFALPLNSSNNFRAERWNRTEYVAIGGFGVSYFLKPQAPSAFFVGEIGSAVWGQGGQLIEFDYTGIGFVVGAGYEFSRHWSLEADIFWVKTEPPDKGFSHVIDTSKALSFRITINFMHY